ncbi:FAD-binding oxidoreductase [Poseidonocella sp. HB161398]|uniref:FAD-binding oxidoreductase n=1 Tax=Poseidonocella sp. HB161398 TaxID=2320855 RepID=UPI0011096A03|nr:FAD-binding oxidoreductase [Poseidonocella sp. HB161398]
MELETLRSAVRGTVVSDRDPGYPAICDALLFNGRKPARRPRLIVEAADAEDVRRAVRYAAAEGLAVSARGGGHNWSGVAQQAGMVIDLRRLDAIRIDPVRRRAEAGPAATNRRMAAALDAAGLAFPLGHCGSVPLSGYLLGGGLGWNAGSWGVACFSVESLEAVLADGRLVSASAAEHPGLFWAAQGGGPLFPGIVTGYRLRLQEAPGAICTALHIYPSGRAEALAGWMERLAAEAPACLEMTAKFCPAPPPFADRAAHLAIGIATVFARDGEEADRVLAEVAQSAPAGAIGQGPAMPTPFATLYDTVDAAYPEGRRMAVDALWSDAPAALFAALARGVERAPTPECHAIATLPSERAPLPGDGAFSMRARAFGAVYSLWQDPAADAEGTGWMRGVAEAAAPVTRGVYVGEADLARPGRIRQAYSPAALDRLLALRARYDPAGLFRRDIAGLPLGAGAAEPA